MLIRKGCLLREKLNINPNLTFKELKYEKITSETWAKPNRHTYALSLLGMQGSGWGPSAEPLHSRAYAASKQNTQQDSPGIAGLGAAHRLLSGPQVASHFCFTTSPPHPG